MELKFQSFKDVLPEFESNIIVKVTYDNCIKEKQYRVYIPEEGLWVSLSCGKDISLSDVFSNEKFRLYCNEFVKIEWAYLE